MSKKVLVAYFSASGTTRKIAKEIANDAKADLFEIVPEKVYSSADLNWNDKNSRSSKEMDDPKSRPAVSSMLENAQQYDTVFIGFPIWWYAAPKIINTFLESYDFSGKTIIPFATSGSSGLGNTVKILRKSCSDSALWNEGKLLNNSSAAKIAQWIKDLNI